MKLPKFRWDEIIWGKGCEEKTSGSPGPVCWMIWGSQNPGTRDWSLYKLESFSYPQCMLEYHDPKVIVLHPELFWSRPSHCLAPRMHSTKTLAMPLSAALDKLEAYGARRGCRRKVCHRSSLSPCVELLMHAGYAASGVADRSKLHCSL